MELGHEDLGNPQPIQIVKNTKLKRFPSVGKNVDKLELSFIDSRNLKWCSHFEKQYGNSSNS